MQRLRSLDSRRILRRGRQRCGLRTCRRTITSLLVDLPSVSDDHVNSCLQRRCPSFPRIYRGAIRGCIRFVQGGRRVPPTEWLSTPLPRKIKTRSIVCVALGDGRCALVVCRCPGLCGQGGPPIANYATAKVQSASLL